MGRININFHVSHGLTLTHKGIVHDMIPAKDLAMMLLNLPGTTNITGCFTGLHSPSSAYTENTVEATNDLFPDGTTVEARYVEHRIYAADGSFQAVNNYDGFVLNIPIPSPHPQQFSVGGGVAVKMPPGFTVSIKGGGGGGSKSVSGTGTLGPCTSPHDWTTYNGFNDSYEYCMTCGVKK